jgi:hypothetical protein
MKTYNELDQDVNTALGEYQRNKQISPILHNKICDNSIDIIEKLTSNQQSLTPEMLTIYSLLNNRVNEYMFKTGNFIGINEALNKFVEKKIKIYQT